MKVCPLGQANKQTRLVWKWVRAAVVEASSRKLFRGNNFPPINHDLGESVTASKTNTKPRKTITTMPTITNSQLWPWWKYPCLYSPPGKCFSFFLRNSLTGSDLPPPFMFCQTKTSTAVFVSLSSSYLGMCFRLCAFFGGNIYILAFQKDWLSLYGLLWLLCVIKSKNKFILKTVNQWVPTKNCLNKWISCVFVIDVY